MAYQSMKSDGQAPVTDGYDPNEVFYRIFPDLKGHEGALKN